MVLAAGLGLRMRPLTLSLPKALVPVAGRPLIDHSLDRLALAGVTTAVVNVHHFADPLVAHLARRKNPKVVISDERDRLLETGGGIAKALPLLGKDPFYVLNSDSIWIEGPRSNLARLAEAWDGTRMSALLMLAATVVSVGYSGAGDFTMDATGRLLRREERKVAPFVYAGVAIVDPRLFAGVPEGPFSFNLLFDRAIEAERLYGMRMDGTWLHVGTPEAVADADRSVAASAA